jgi:prepilin-type N-terminal cleavage/methylation domain-containing protein
MKRGFTLLEMSIVLVVIGLLVGGIMLGRSILTTSRLQTVITDADNYTTAIGNFKQQYQGLPGDLVNATSFWGTDSTSCPSGGGTTGTCNGNGDGQIGGISGSGNEFESFRFWQHLHLAGFATQNFSGVAGSSSTLNAVIGTNVPSGSMEGSGFSVVWEGGGNAMADTTNYYTGSYNNILVFGNIITKKLTYGPILTPDQAASLDRKIDDGVPGTGNVRTMLPTSTYAPSCAVGSTASTSTYNTSSSGVLCSLIFLTGY